MKLTTLILIALCFSTQAGKKQPNYEYSHGDFTAVIYANNPAKGVIYGPQFPYGITIKVDPDQAHNLPDNVIEIIDALFVFDDIVNP